MWINWQTRTHALIREAVSPSLSQRAGTAPGNPSSPWLPRPVSHRTVLNTCDERSPGPNAAHRWAHRTTHVEAAQNWRLTRRMASASRRTHP